MAHKPTSQEFAQAYPVSRMKTWMRHCHSIHRVADESPKIRIRDGFLRETSSKDTVPIAATAEGVL